MHIGLGLGLTRGQGGGVAFTLVLNGQPITLNAQFITLTPES